MKDGSWLTVAFHNSSEKAWIVIQEALADAGFKIRGTQIFDKKHGTVKMFVSDNAVGYDLIIHCQKSQLMEVIDQPIDKGMYQAKEFIKEYLDNGNILIKDFLHVSRKSEFDYRRVYSAWLAKTVQESVIAIDFETFREIVDQVQLEKK